jgi:hypothetical protein
MPSFLLLREKVVAIAGGSVRVGEVTGVWVVAMVGGVAGVTMGAGVLAMAGGVAGVTTGAGVLAMVEV